MAKIYLVSEGCYSDFHIEAAFSTEEKAMAFEGELRKIKGRSDTDIQEFEIDEVADNVCRQCWICEMVLDNGIVRGTHTEHRMASPLCRGESKIGLGAWWIAGISFESPEHAMKLAAERRQEELRKKAVAPAV